MNKTLLIFVDSFPFARLPNLNRLSTLYRWQIASGLGFSINIKPEIFGGYTADQIGYFNEWMYKTDSRFRHHKTWLKLLSIFSTNYYADRLVHRLLGRFVFKKNILNIPFNYLPYFDAKGTSPYADDFELPTIFSQASKFQCIRYKDISFSPNRDQEIFQKAADRLESDDYNTFFIASADLDNLTHRFGINSNEYNSKLLELDNLIGECIDIFNKRHSDGTTIIVSDHSMAEVTGSVTIKPEQKFGKPSQNSYFYFIDATMLRVWLFDPKLHKPWIDYLSEFEQGFLLSEEERSDYNVRTRSFGDLIFLLHEGLVFNPTFWGNGVARAMHGYHPRTESQKGFIASNHILFGKNGTQISPQQAFYKLYQQTCK